MRKLPHEKKNLNKHLKNDNEYFFTFALHFLPLPTEYLAEQAQMSVHYTPTFTHQINTSTHGKKNCYQRIWTHWQNYPAQSIENERR
jgi:hypothetical protein